ncbi:MAG: transcription antitermination factor NusB [Bacteroidales bacterium]|nr:transcription antitermination factor NusB [Bacteroidales bacterium]
MLSRRHLRVKALQAIYAFHQAGGTTIGQGEKQLLTSIDKIYDLYIYQLSLLIQIIRFAEKRIEENKHKYLPTEEDLNPNTKFVDNQFINQLQDNLEYRRKAEALKISWADHTEMIRKFYNQIRESEAYKEYIASEKKSYQEDKNIILYVFKEIIAPSDDLRGVYEEINIHWGDDYDTVIMMIIRTIKSFKKSDDETTPLPRLYKPVNDEGVNEDKQFVIDLFRKTIINSSEYDKIVENSANNWEIERIALIDTILIKMAIAELLHFKTIPVKVTLNEYIEISKFYSTPKSKMFINGILDRIIAEFRSEDKIVKIGRGLIE